MVIAGHIVGPRHRGVLIVRNAARSAVPGFCRPLKRARMRMRDLVNPRLKPGATVLTQAPPAVREAYAAVAIATIFRTQSESDVAARNARARSVAPGFSRGFKGADPQRCEPASAGDRPEDPR